MDRYVTMPPGHMKASSFARLGISMGLFFAALGSACAGEGVAIALVLDISGSMKAEVRDGRGGKSPKYVIGNRALESVVAKIEQFATNSPNRTVHAGLFAFDDDVQEVVKFGKFDAAAMRRWIKNYPGPGSGTAIGLALQNATGALLNSDLPHKHVLLITDGDNTVGPRPESVLPRLQKAAEKKGALLFTHFVAFDVAASVFAPVKRQGATVVGAGDEKQLNQQLGFVLEEKILLEKDDKK